MKKSKKSIGFLGIFIVALLAVAWILFRGVSTERKGESNKVSRAQLENILAISKATFGYPKMLDEEVRADDASITDKDEFQVLITMLKLNSQAGDYIQALEKLKSQLPGRACDIRQLRFLLYKGITVRLNFKSADGVNLFEYVVTPDMCGEEG